MKNYYLSILLLTIMSSYMQAQDITVDQLKSVYTSDDLHENKPSLALADFLGGSGEETEFADLCYFIMDDLINEMDYFNRVQSQSEEPIPSNEKDAVSNTSFNMAVSSYIKDDMIIAQIQLSKDHGTTLLLDKTMTTKIENIEVAKDFTSMPNGSKHPKALASFYQKIAVPMLNDLLSVVSSNQRLQENPEGETLLMDKKGTYLLVFEDINMSKARRNQSTIHNLEEIDQVQISAQNHHQLRVHTALQMQDLVSLINEHLGEQHIIINQEGSTIYLE